MAFSTQIEPGGRIALPPDVMQELNLHEGDDVWVEDFSTEDAQRESEPALTVQPAPGGALIEEEGLLVWASPGPYTPGVERQVLEAIRKERDLQALGIFATTLD